MTRKLVSVSACAFVLVVWAAAIHAQVPVPRPLSGNTQGYIGSGLPVPVRPGTPSCVPFGGISGIDAKAGAMITTIGGKGGSLKVPASQFTLRGPGNPLGPQVQGVAAENPVALQVYTNFMIQVPNPGGTLKAGGPGFVPKGGAGRTGIDMLSWCPGYTSTVTMGTMGAMTPLGATPTPGNPGCISPANHKKVTVPTCPAYPAPCPGTMTQKVVIPGFMRYTRTGKMLGGPGRTTLQGKFDVAIGATGGGAFFVHGAPPPSAAVGMSFGFYFQMNNKKGPQHAPIMRNSCGLITTIGPEVLAQAASNRTTGSFGGPATQGMITVKALTAKGFESYMLTGYDTRTAIPTAHGLPGGKGKIQLVSGGLGSRSLTGDNANRGFLLYEVPEPAAIAGAIGALLVLVGCHYAVVRRRK